MWLMWISVNFLKLKPPYWEEIFCFIGKVDSGTGSQKSKKSPGKPFLFS
jgi:hypothetical protein